MKKILVTGSTGMLGKRLVEELLHDDSIEVFGVARGRSPELKNSNQRCIDFTEEGFELQLKSWLEPDVVIHTVANVDLSYCQKHPDEAWRIHVGATKRLAERWPSTRFIYVSTDSIFDGQAGNYSEDDIPMPLNVYARTKFEGELAAMETCGNAVIVRTNMYGQRLKKEGGVNGLADWAIASLMNSAEIAGFTDVLFNPLYVGQLSRALTGLALKQDGFKGIINVGSTETISKYEFVRRLAQEFQLDEGLVKRSEMNAKAWEFERPLNTSLNVSKCKTILGHSFSIRDGISELHINYKQL